MVFKSGPSPAIIKKVADLGGYIWTTDTDWVAGGTGTARTAINASFPTPDAARTMLGWRPIDVLRNLAAAESQGSVFDIIGGNFKLQPQEVLGPSDGSLLLEGVNDPSDPEYYDVFAPISGGEQINVGIEPLDAVAGDRGSNVEFTWTNVRLDTPVVFSRCSREVSLGTAAGDTAATTFDESNTHVLIEAGATVHHQGAVTVEQELAVRLSLRSTVWEPVQELTIVPRPVGPTIDETIDQGLPRCYVSRRAQLLGFRKESSRITGTWDLDVLTTVASSGTHMIRWV